MFARISGYSRLTTRPFKPMLAGFFKHTASGRPRAFVSSYATHGRYGVNNKIVSSTGGTESKEVDDRGKLHLKTLCDVEKFTKDIPNCTKEFLNSINLIDVGRISIITDQDVLVINRLLLALMHQQHNFSNLTHLVFGRVQKNIALINYVSSIQSLFFLCVECSLYLKHLSGIVQVQIGEIGSGAKIHFPSTIKDCFIIKVFGETVIENLEYLEKITIDEVYANLTIQNLRSLDSVRVTSFHPSSKKFDINSCSKLRLVGLKEWHEELNVTKDGVSLFDKNKE